MTRKCLTSILEANDSCQRRIYIQFNWIIYMLFEIARSFSLFSVNIQRSLKISFVVKLHMWRTCNIRIWGFSKPEKILIEFILFRRMLFAITTRSRSFFSVALLLLSNIASCNGLCYFFERSYIVNNFSYFQRFYHPCYALSLWPLCKPEYYSLCFNQVQTMEKNVLYTNRLTIRTRLIFCFKF